MKASLLFIAICFGFSVMAQNAKQVATKYNKVEVPGVEATYNNSRDVVETALSNYFNKKKSKKKILQRL